MQSTKKYLLYAGVFVLFILIGFGVAWLIKGCGETETSDSSGDGGNTPVDSPIVEPAPESPAILPVSIVVDGKQQKGNSYILQVHAENIPENVVPLFRIDQIGRKSTNGIFTDIPGNQSGIYIVQVVNNSTGEELASLVVGGFDVIKPAFEEKEQEVSKMSAGEFQSLLLNQNDNSLLGGKNPKVARTVIIRAQGLEEGERAPGDILAVREKIANGIWTSARVVSVGYDNSGRINSVTIQPVY
ncbi:MAG: hypothetical protein J5616_03515 [Bacteroidaceae bacterium]|nr:hypothetical protein [Bacteroidaceae bacterium]